MSGTKYAKAHIAELQAEYQAGVLSTSAVAAKYQMHEATLRLWVKRYGWIRIDQDVRRAVVSAGLQGAEIPKAPEGSDRSVGLMLDAAAEDLNDMDLGLQNARAALKKVYDALHLPGIIVPQDLKVLSETNRINIDTIRRIRAMDDPADQDNHKVQSVLEMVMGKRDGLPGAS